MAITAMELSEKVAYLKGLIEGLGYTKDTKEGKVILAMTDILEELALAVSDIEDGMELLSKQIDDMDEEFEDAFGEHFDDDDDDYDDYFDGEIYEITCPSCNNTVCIDEDMLDNGEMDCPNCGENLEFDLEDLLDDENDNDEGLKF